MVAGRIVAEGPPASLGFRDHAKARIRYRVALGVTPPAGVGGPAGVDGFIEVAVDDAVTALHTLTGWAIEQGVALEGLEVARPSLEDVYLALTSGDAEGSQP
jgi:ABC-2 type transport system ATP-binding protein